MLPDLSSRAAGLAVAVVSWRGPSDPVVLEHAMRSRWPVFIARVGEDEWEYGGLARYRVWLRVEHGPRDRRTGIWSGSRAYSSLDAATRDARLLLERRSYSSVAFF